MNKTEIIDTRGLAHTARESLIFPTLESLEQGQNQRYLFEFNPIPLVYMLKMRGEFEISFDEEGPSNWILNVKRTTGGNNKEHLKSLLNELKGGNVSEETKERAKIFFKNVDAKTVGVLEQELIREGVSHDEVRKSLCDIHLDVMKDSLVKNRLEAPLAHPIHTLMEEHKIIKENLVELSEITSKIKTIFSFDEFSPYFNSLKSVAHHLVEAELHHKREEDALFPFLEKHDVVEPPKIMKLDHIEFLARKKELANLVHDHGNYHFELFKQNVIRLGEYLSKELDSHIFKEDNILYQISLQVITEEEWSKIKEKCDKIGYCCFTPHQCGSDNKIVELDLRSIPPFERHLKIFNTWEGLHHGEAMRIINDHDPKPLRYQFEAEENGKYEWVYEEQGPKDWQVKIKRV